MSFDLNIFLGIVYLATIYVAITIVYALVVTDFFMRMWKSKQISGMKRFLLVTAHPDDECMFFGPTIVSLAKNPDVRIYVLCLSLGDYEGMGNLRKLELWHSCKKLGVNESNITCLNYQHLRDNPKILWQPCHMAKVILHHVNMLDIDTLITFDGYGVSGHLNHISIYNCIAELMQNRLIPPTCRVFSLESVSWFRKFILGVFDVYLSYMTSTFMYVTNEVGRSLIRSAMEVHVTQYVWYRKLYMVFSRYINVNTFREIPHQTSPEAGSAAGRHRKFPLFRRNSSQRQKTE
ncbi:N-acetylglucosaminyl-phosphatidylinositol de-N-acetylase [Orchesella cincta]|uniref:N-acetylglucosaminylphosphatidylinositol deacetylase n=1 Tax=Orchesella cincta TaxID=48709 RepID=A0A1D2NNH3_ORCCI|nr:N-acetylglucosaminyl-phosphatidylinositol de-N-acetylase [Orchesella cincta]